MRADQRAAEAVSWVFLDFFHYYLDGLFKLGIVPRHDQVRAVIDFDIGSHAAVLDKPLAVAQCFCARN